MTREEFKDAVLNILLNEEYIDDMKLFDTNDMSRYKITQYDEEHCDVEAAMPLNELLDDIYDAIMCEEDER